MKTCIAYTPIAGSRSAWLPCLRAAVVGEKFCRRHGDAITGAVFGALMYGPVVDEEVTIVEDRPLPRYARVTVKRKRRKKNQMEEFEKLRAERFAMQVVRTHPSLDCAKDGPPSSSVEKKTFKN